MNSSLRMAPGWGIWALARLAAASLKETSEMFSEKVEKAFSLTSVSGCGSSGGNGCCETGASWSMAMGGPEGAAGVATAKGLAVANIAFVTVVVTYPTTLTLVTLLLPGATA